MMFRLILSAQSAAPAYRSSDKSHVFFLLFLNVVAVIIK
jgi:hypothetical protein